MAAPDPAPAGRTPAIRPPAGRRHNPRAAPGPYLGRPDLRRPPALEPPYDDDPPTRLRVVPQRERLPFDDLPPRTLQNPPDFFAPQPTTRDELPDPERWALRFLPALLEALVGRRPTTQLQEWTTPLVMAFVVRTAAAGRWPHRSTTSAALRSMRITEPANGIAEISAVVQHGERYSALAARLEGLDHRWRCTALQLG